MAGKSARWKVGEMVRARLFGPTKAEEAARAKEAAEERAAKEAADIVWKEAFGDESQQDDQEKREKSEQLVRIAWLIVHHPKLRAEYFAGPEVLLEQYLPDSRPGILGSPPILRLRAVRPGDTAARHKLALLIELLINDDERLISAKETFHERESFLSAGVQDPEKTFGVVAEMSKTTFNVGLGLVFVGVGFALLAAIADVVADPSTTEQISLGALGAFFGGTGVVTTLLAVFKASTKELRTITSDMAKIHMILTGYGAETTNLRKIKVDTDVAAAAQNEQFRKITKHAVELLPSDRTPAEDEEGKTTKE